MFGCVCFVLVPGELRNKLEARSTKAMFTGYSTRQKGYKCCVPKTRRVLVSRDVKFIESRGYYGEQSWSELKDMSQSASYRASNLRVILERLGINMPKEHEKTMETLTRDIEAEKNIEVTHPDHEGGNGTGTGTDENQTGAQTKAEENSVAHDHDDMPSGGSKTLAQVGEPSKGVEPDQIQLVRRSTRIKRPASEWRAYFNAEAVAHPTSTVCSLAQYPEEHQVFIGELDQEYIPKTYEEAMQDEEWRESVGGEIGAMIKNDT